MTRRLTTEEFIEKAKEIHGKKYTYENSEYVTAKVKLNITCSTHGGFDQTPSDHLQGKGCRFCANNVKFTKKDFIERAIQTHGDKYTYEKVVYQNVDTPVTITCPNHGDFDQTPYAHASMGQGCADCVGLKPKTTTKFIENAISKHGDRYGYEKVNYVNNKTKVVIRCKTHGYFSQSPSDHLNSGGCFECFGSPKLTTEEFTNRARTIHGDTYIYDEVIYENYHSDVNIICRKHGTFRQSPSNHFAGKGCLRCKNKEEGKVAEILNDRAVVHRQFSLDSGSTRRLFDFYLPDYNLLIERDGEQHYPDIFKKEPNVIFAKDGGGYETIQANDKLKTTLAKQKGYKIVRLPYWLIDEELALEIDNILVGKPTYPDVPDPEQEKTKPKPVKKF